MQLPDLAGPSGAGEIDLGIRSPSVKRVSTHESRYRNILLVMRIILPPAASVSALHRCLQTDDQEIDHAFDKGRSHIGSWAIR